MPVFNQVTAGQFARELACGIEPLADLLDSWGITLEFYQELRQVEWFQRELVQAVSDMKDMGPNSAFIMRCRGIAEETLGDMLNIIKSEKAEPSVRAAVFKQISDLARLAPQKTEVQQQPTGPVVAFHFGGHIKGIPESLLITPDIPKQVSSPQSVASTLHNIIDVDL